MRALTPALLALLVLVGFEARAACEYPADIQVPDLAAATEAEVAAAKSLVTGYIKQMDIYLACLDKEFAALPADQQTDEQKALLTKRHNAAVDAEEAAAARYNEQIRARKAAGK